MDYLPVCLKLTGERVLLVGAGAVATRKARLLLRAGAHLDVVAPDIDAELRALLTPDCRVREREYHEEDLEGVSVVVAATASGAINRQVSADAQRAALPVNVVDAPELCTFIFPAIIDRDPILVAVSSGGRSPVLTRILRRKIESMIPSAYGRLGAFAGRLRDRVKQAIENDTQRRLFWEQMLEGAVAEQVMAGREDAGERMLEEQLANLAENRGEVYLVGAGPGDPDLLTFKAARLLQSADVVLYDALVSDEILDMARRDAQRIYVGKRRANHTLPQAEINQLLLELARSGQRVVRLKGGDPFIFGRGGEEIELLAREGIPFQVVPGITAANGAACYAGIPLTHRDYAQSVRFVAGYLKGDRVEHDWQQMQNPAETLVFYMGLVGLPLICEQLMAHGRAPETPVALIERGTSSRQRVLTGTLETMTDVVARAAPEAPTLIIVGDVVRLHRELAWFGEAPGAG
ncbi:MAG: uroporphyrinogen-III C-methyltransferase [Halioglobus sp.]|nr:uroporphyrinogen-III C-methyltransferase [Halioglobus sp.]